MRMIALPTALHSNKKPGKTDRLRSLYELWRSFHLAHNRWHSVLHGARGTIRIVWVIVLADGREKFFNLGTFVEDFGVEWFWQLLVETCLCDDIEQPALLFFSLGCQYLVLTFWLDFYLKDQSIRACPCFHHRQYHLLKYAKLEELKDLRLQ